MTQWPNLPYGFNVGDGVGLGVGSDGSLVGVGTGSDGLVGLGNGVGVGVGVASVGAGDAGTPGVGVLVGAATISFDLASEYPEAINPETKNKPAAAMVNFFLSIHTSLH